MQARMTTSSHSLWERPKKEEAREVERAKVEINPALTGEHHTLAPIWRTFQEEGPTGEGTRPSGWSQRAGRHGRRTGDWTKTKWRGLQLVQLPPSDNATQSTAAAGLVGLKSKPQSLKSHLEMTVDESKHEAAESVKWAYSWLRGEREGDRRRGPRSPVFGDIDGGPLAIKLLGCMLVPLLGQARPCHPGMTSSGLHGLFMQPDKLASTSHSIHMDRRDVMAWPSHMRHHVST
ncbi:hypothetical protein CEP53_010788 [Fusarium sp. AF-6]|nr:hypothetical protein CEP53_010788 [Fusarium sp. AF-6]